MVQVIGIGGAGTNIAAYVLAHNRQGVECCCVNTDTLSLERFSGGRKVLLDVEKGEAKDAMSELELGKHLRERNDTTLKDLITPDAKVVFLVAGLGGRTGSTLLPSLVHQCNLENKTVVCFVAMPFKHEGETRKAMAEKAWQNIAGVSYNFDDFSEENSHDEGASENSVAKGTAHYWAEFDCYEGADYIFTVSNEKLRKLYGSLPFQDAFEIANKILLRAVDIAVQLIDEYPNEHLRKALCKQWLVLSEENSLKKGPLWGVFYGKR
jgi:cell division GTPase FtsZ